MKLSNNYILREIAGEKVVVKQGTHGVDMKKHVGIITDDLILYNKIRLLLRDTANVTLARADESADRYDLLLLDTAVATDKAGAVLIGEGIIFILKCFLVHGDSFPPSLPWGRHSLSRSISAELSVWKDPFWRLYIIAYIIHEKRALVNGVSAVFSCRRIEFFDKIAHIREAIMALLTGKPFSVRRVLRASDST